MVKRFSKISNQLSNELKGFEDIFQEYVESEEEKERVRNYRDAAKNTETYELQNFLEEENSRLSNLEVFFTKKMPAKMNYSQTERLIVDQMKRKEILVDKISNELTKADTIFQKNISSLFNSHFS